MKLAKLPITYIQASPDHWTSIDSEVIVEAPVSLTVNGEVWLTFMCTPIDLEAMAVGFLYNEGVISSMAEIASVFLCATGDNVDVWIDHAVDKPDKWRRTSGCTGGFTAVDETSRRIPAVEWRRLTGYAYCSIDRSVIRSSTGSIKTPVGFIPPVLAMAGKSSLSQRISVVTTPWTSSPDAT